MEEAERLREGGMSYRAIGERVGRSAMRVWSVLNPDRRSAHQKRWGEKNPYYERDRRRAYKEENPEYRKTLAEQAKKRREEHPEVRERERRQSARWGRTHTAEKAAYRRAHLAESAACAATRRARKKARTVKGVEDRISALYKKVRTAPRVQCYLCGKSIPKDERQVDHIVPIAKDGLHAPQNLAASCARCNMSKGAKLPAEVGLLL